MKSIKTILFIVVSIVAISLLTTVFNYNNDKAFEYIITFLSIAVGFNITAMSIIANSPFSSRLYNIEDKDDNSRTLLHVLIRKFRTSIGLFLSTITIILLYYFIDGGNATIHTAFCVVKGYAISVPHIIKGIVWYMTIVSSLKFNELLITFTQLVVKSAPKN